MGILAPRRKGYAHSKQQCAITKQQPSTNPLYSIFALKCWEAVTWASPLSSIITVVKLLNSCSLNFFMVKWK